VSVRPQISGKLPAPVAAEDWHTRCIPVSCRRSRRRHRRPKRQQIIPNPAQSPAESEV
jgi:hypothetical protein